MDLLLSFGTAILGGLVVLGGWLLIIGRKLQVLDDLKEGLDGLKKDVGRIDDRLEVFSQSATGAIVEIQTHLTSRGFKINQRVAYTSGSPIHLTDYGETILKESGFFDAMKDENNRQKMTTLVRAKNPKTNYDIQQFAADVVREISENNDPVGIRLKNYAYEKGLPLGLVVNSAGIVLRDEVMKTTKFDDTI